MQYLIHKPMNWPIRRTKPLSSTTVHCLLIIVHCLLFTVHCSLLTAQEMIISATFDSTHILIGDQTTLHLTATLPANTTIEYPKLDGEKLGELELIKVHPIDTISTNPMLILQQDITLAAFDSGQYVVPVLPFAVTLVGQSPKTLRSNFATINAHFVPIDTAAIEPIKPIIEEPYKLEDALPFVYILLAILAVILLFRFLRQRFQAQPLPAPPPPPLPAHVLALRQLDKLKAAKLWQQGETKKYHTQLSYILREYIENRYQKAALESTTDQILHDLSTLSIDKEQCTQFRQVLELADLVKFAKAKPQAQDNEQHLEFAYAFVRATQNVNQPEEPDEELTPEIEEEET